MSRVEEGGYLPEASGLRRAAPSAMRGRADITLGLSVRCPVLDIERDRLGKFPDPCDTQPVG